MKNSRFRSLMLTSFATAMAMPGVCSADSETVEVGAADVGKVDAATIAAGAAAVAEARKRAPAANFLPIVRGRLPLLFVHAIRFDKVLNAMGNKDLAAKFATSVGKVFDIKKGRNFAYVGEDFKPSAEDVSSAEAWISQVGKENAKGLATTGDTTLMQSTLDQYKAAGLATAEDAAKFAAARASTRVVTAKAVGGAALPAAGASEAVTSTAGSADDLLG